MSANEVFEQMKSYYESTGEVMPASRFVTEIASRNYHKKQIIDGIMIFNEFLDSQRRINS